MNPANHSPPPQIGLPPEQFAAAFPFHFAVDAGLTILQVGSSLRRVCPDVRPGARLAEVFRPIRPAGRISFEWVLENRARFFLLEHNGAGKLQLRGQFVALPGGSELLFLGSPWLTDSEELVARGLSFEDFAVHNPLIDLLLVLQGSKMALEDAKRLADKLASQRAELRAANERLRAQESEARTLALIAARTDNAVVLTDAAGAVVWVNEGFTRLTGYPLDEVLGRKPGAVLQGPGTDPATVQRIRGRLAKGEGFTEDILNYRKDGREYWAAIEVQPIHDETGRVANYMSIESDITERRAAQQRLGIQLEVSSLLAEADDESEAMVRILEIVGRYLGWQLGLAWQVADERLRFVTAWNSAAASAADFVAASRGTEFARGEGLLGRVWAERTVCWVRDVACDANFLRAGAAVRARLHGAFAFPVIMRDETCWVVEFFSGTTADPDETLQKTFAAIGRQIGQFIARRRTERALRRSEELFRLALEGGELGAWDLHVPSGVATVNERYLEMLGLTPGRVEPSVETWLRHVHPDDLPQVTAAFKAHLRGDTEVYEAEHRMRHASGTWIWVLDRGQVTDRAPDGRAIRVCGTLLDITERKAVERELSEEKQLLEQARQRELATGHDIQRTLLIGDLPAAVRGVELASYTEPSQGIDGDLYAFTTYRPDCLELLVGDVMGKGVPAALIGAAVRTAYNQVVTELLAASLGSEELPRPAAIVNALHATLTPRLIELDSFVTLALYRFDLAAGSMTYVNAGHTPGLFISAAGAIHGVLGVNLPVGVVDEEHYVEATEAVAPGDVLLVYSDGITEARNALGVEFGDDRLRGFLERVGGHALPASICLQALRKTVRAFVGDQTMVDDQTAVLVGFRATSDDGGVTPHAGGPEEFDMPWDTGGLEPLRKRVAGASSMLEPGAADLLVLAAFEAATNVVRHVAPPFRDATLTCRVLPGRERVVVEIWHVGAPFTPAPDPLPDFSGASDGGFGLYIIKHAVSEVHYENPLPDVCCTRLIQQGRGPASA